MAMFGLILHVVTIMSLRFEVRGEMTADLVFSVLSDRFDDLAIETYSLKSELRSSVAAINDRIDIIIKNSHSPLHSNTYSTEKINVNNVLTDYEEKLIEFQRAVSDQMNVMNTTIETSLEQMGRKLEENAGNINNSVHQLITHSETKFQDVIEEFETVMNNASIEHETTRSDFNEFLNMVKDIEDDLSNQSSRISAVDNRLSSLLSNQSSRISALDNRLSSLHICPHGKYGNQCHMNCSDNCGNTCNHVSGSCDGICKSGWKGDKCETECSNNKYGQGCAKKCSTNCKHGTCNHVSGTCDDECKDGWKGDKCEDACYDGWYDNNFSKMCSKNCFAVHTTRKCSNVNGRCLSGCKPGSKIQLCNTVCPLYTYGPQCKNRCSWNCKQHTCNHVDGECDRGCRDGWQGDMCVHKCHTGRYGSSCANECSQHCEGGQQKCSYQDGRCLAGCKPGWDPPLCAEECSNTTYGQRCSSRCNRNCKRGTCNHVDGKCDGGCKDGWQGDTCSSRCPSGTYGNQCGQTCSLNCRYNYCNHDNGECQRCKVGWKDAMCKSECPGGKYGYRCRQECNDRCIDGKCSHINGKCENGCKAGWQGEFCNSECDNGFYGLNCSEICGRCNDGTVCDKVTGVCPNGCSSGYSGDLCKSEYWDCSEIILHEPNAQDGVYGVVLWRTKRNIQVYCDMTTDGGGWTVFQNRFNGSVDFYRNYSQYVEGFGDLHQEFWLGLEFIQEMTSQTPVNELRIDLMAANGTAAYEVFSSFSLSPPAYVLNVGKTTSSNNIGSSSSRFGPYHNGQAFSTYDHDVDSASANCASYYHSAWWYRKCRYADLNGQNATPGSTGYTGITYHSFIYKRLLKESKMSFRRMEHS